MPFLEISRILFEYTANCLELCINKNDMSMRKCFYILCPILVTLILTSSCEIVDNDPDMHHNDTTAVVGLEEVAEIFALIPIQSVQLHEVHDAVTSSSGNGYDEEYTMRNLFENPGFGVGDRETRSGRSYPQPLRALIEECIRNACATKTVDKEWMNMEAEDVIQLIMESDMQIYWPFSENWDGRTMPIITFDPEDGSNTNVGYEYIMDDDGFHHVRQVLVDEEIAKEVPVWIINRNSDAGYSTLEMLRREDPDWGEGGGNIIVRPSAAGTKASSAPLRSLVLKDFTMNRNYDSWFAGASEFFVKTGYVDDFTASTEAEIRLYNPLVTDFMVVVKRSQVGIPQPFNAIIMSDWSSQMTHCAFMITEDDGGTRTDWSAKAKVFVAGKSYGVEVTIPLNTRDDIVWRGQLASRWLEENSDVTGHFGDVDLTFEILEY